MTQPDDIAARLPAPRDDEPRELRQDIVDELADHLACAVNRERLLQGGASEAGTTDDAGEDVAGGATGDPALLAALEKFGDPAAVARRLWFDAMKERIMTQRVKFVFAAAGGAFVALAAVFLGQMILRVEALQATVVDLERRLAESSPAAATNPSPVATTPPIEPAYNRLVVSLIDSARAPVQGKVRFVRSTRSQGQKLATATSEGSTLQAFVNIDGFSEEVHTSAEGLADFGRQLQGDYLIYVTLDERGEETTFAHTLGDTIDKLEVVCPTVDEPAGPLQFAIQTPPAVAEEKRIGYVAQLHRTSFRFADRTWRESATSAPRLFWLNSLGKVVCELSAVDATQADAQSVSAFADYIPSESYCLPPDEQDRSVRLSPGEYDFSMAAYIAPHFPLERIRYLSNSYPQQHQNTLAKTITIDAIRANVIRVADRDLLEVQFWREVRDELNSMRRPPRGPGEPTAYYSFDADATAPTSDAEIKTYEPPSAGTVVPLGSDDQQNSEDSKPVKPAPMP